MMLSRKTLMHYIALRTAATENICKRWPSTPAIPTKHLPHSLGRRRVGGEIEEMNAMRQAICCSGCNSSASAQGTTFCTLIGGPSNLALNAGAALAAVSDLSRLNAVAAAWSELKKNTATRATGRTRGCNNYLPISTSLRPSSFQSYVRGCMDLTGLETMLTQRHLQNHVGDP
jgi:hypothetical protein